MAQITINRDDLEKMAALAIKHNTKKFFMAKDQGAYVGVTGGRQEDGTFESHIVYFNGCNPKTDADYYDNAQDKFGGDDFGEHFDMAIIHKLVADPLTIKMVLNVGRSSMSLKSYSRPAPKITPTSTVKVTPTNDAARAAVKAAAAKALAPTKTKKRTIGAAAMEHIAAGLSNDEVLAAVKAEFPDAQTSKASVNWYRNKMKKG